MFSIVKRIINWTGSYKKRMYLGFFYSFLSAMFTAIPIAFGAYIFDLILNDYYGKTKFPREYIFITMIVMILSILGRFLFSYLRATTGESIGYERTAEQRIELGIMLKRVPLGFFHKNNTGELTSAVTTDLSFLEMFAIKMVDMVISGYISAIVMCMFLVFYSPLVAVIVILGASLSAFFLFLLEKRSRKNAPTHQKSKDDMIENTLEYLRGMPVVKSFKQEGVSVNGIKTAYQNSKEINLKIEREYISYNCFHLFSLKTASVLMVLTASYLTIIGSLELPIFLMMSIFSFSIYGNIETLSNAAHVLEMIDETLDKFDRIKNTKFIDEDGKNIEPSNYDIEFDNVSFSYEEKTVIDEVSFKISQHMMTAIVGPSGSGKTTICNLIARFYDVKSGSIFIGGHNLKEFTCDSLLSNISMVFQKVYLFHDTIKNNIKFGNPSATDEEIIYTSKNARCHDFIMALPNGYDTMIGESGSTLSGGEKQRISIARAMLKDAPIIILDEATSSIDPENEHLIQEAISKLTFGKTIIIIAHRLATIQNADQILVMDNGVISQCGTHMELIKKDGIYKKFIGIRKKAEEWSF